MSKFTMTSQNQIMVGDVDNQLECMSVFSQIDCDLKYFNVSVQVINNDALNANLISVKAQFEDELCIIFTKAKDMGWNIFDDIKTKLETL